MKKITEYASLATAMVAAMMLAFHVPFAGWAFVIYLISNTMSLYILKDSNAPKVIIYQLLFFFVMNLIGIDQWLMNDQTEASTVCTQTK